MKPDTKELDTVDETCATKILKWTIFKRGNVETYEPVGVAISAFRPTRWILDAFKLVDAIDASFKLVRNDDKTFTATFADRTTTHTATKPTASYAITVAALHYVLDAKSGRRGPIGPELDKMR